MARPPPRILVYPSSRKGFYCPFTPTPTYTQALFRNIDINESGELDYTEFLGAGLQARHVTKPSIKAAFAILDRNGDGFITKVQRQRRQDGGEPGARFSGALLHAIPAGGSGGALPGCTWAMPDHDGAIPEPRAPAPPLCPRTSCV